MNTYWIELIDLYTDTLKTKLSLCFSETLGFFLSKQVRGVLDDIAVVEFREGAIKSPSMKTAST